MRIPLGVTKTPNRKVTTMFRGSALRLTGGDETITQNPEFTAFLAKAFVQMAAGKKHWPIFEERRLGQVLTALGIDLNDQLSKVDEPLVLPSFFTRPEVTAPMLRGLSFLTTDASSAAEHLRQRELLQRTV